MSTSDFTSPTANIRPITMTGEVQDLLRVAAEHDHIAPISGGLLEAAHGTEATQLALYADDALIGYAIAARQGERGAAELVIAPQWRGQHRAAALVDTLREALGTHVADTWFWSHGDFPAAQALASERGYTRSRELLQLSTPPLSTVILPPVVLPDGVTIRTFDKGDEEQWRRVNNAAFDWHPEQGHQSADAFAQIVSSPDFDPAGVFFALRDGQIIGFHETKMKSEGSSAPLGEVYVVGVDPAVHARGVGRALTVAGMHHLADSGVSSIELYVESDNTAARRLYDSLGFENSIVHVSYSPPPPRSPDV